MLTIDDLVSVVYNTALNPWVAAVASGIKIFLDRRPTSLADAIDGVPRKALYYVLGCVGFRLCDYLNRRALNNGVTDKYDWSQEIVVVTDGAGGIGGELVGKLASRGTRVAVLDVIPLTYDKPSNVEYLQCDISEEASLRAAADQIRKKWGHPTVLCALAGIVRGKQLLESPARDIEMIFKVNVMGVALCYKEFVPAMVKANHGHVVTMSSHTAYLVANGIASYAASKAAVLALHEGLQTELKHNSKALKVRCTVLLPSVVSTNMFTSLNSPSAFMMPMLKPEGVAKTIAETLWSGEARHIELPGLTRWTGALGRALPTFMRIGMQDASSGAMNEFNGRRIAE